MRKHSIANIHQHYETIKQFLNKQDEYEDWLNWFKTLPVFYESDSFRAVHAAWDNTSISFLRHHLSQNKLTDDLIEQSTIKGSELYHAIETTLKGKEIRLPKGHYFEDKDGTHRMEMRIKWWENPVNSTYKDLSIEPMPKLEDIPIDTSLLPPTTTRQIIFPCSSVTTG